SRLDPGRTAELELAVDVERVVTLAGWDRLAVRVEQVEAKRVLGVCLVPRHLQHPSDPEPERALGRHLRPAAADQRQLAVRDLRVVREHQRHPHTGNHPMDSLRSESMPEKRYLFTPGPTPVPPEVLEVLARPAIH